MTDDHLPPSPPPLSDAPIVAILDFLERCITDFENTYADQIHRYYHDRTAFKNRGHVIQ